MKVTLILCDHAEAAEGKLFINGGGWSVAGPGPITFGIGIKIEVPWDAANQKHQLALSLVTTDGEQVSVSGPFGEQPVQVTGEFEVGRPPGLKPGTPIDYVLALNMAGLEIPPDGRYEWRMSIDGHEDENWRLGFNTRPVPLPNQLPPGAPPQEG